MALEETGLKFVTEGEAALEQALARLESRQDAYREAVERGGGALDAQALKLQAASQRFQELSDKQDKLKAKYAEASAKLEELNQRFDKGGADAKKYRDQLEKIEAELNANTRALTNQGAALITQASALEKSAAKLNEFEAGARKSHAALDIVRDGLSRMPGPLGQVATGLFDANGNLGAFLATAGGVGAAIGVFTALAGAIKASVSEAVTYTNTISSIESASGFSADFVARFAQSADDAAISARGQGVELEKTGSLLTKFAISLGKAADENGNFTELTKAQEQALASLGVNLDKVSSQEDALLKVADGFQKTDSAAVKAAAAQALFGRGGSELIPILEKGAAGIRDLNAAVDKAFAPTPESQQAARDYKANVDALADGWQRLKLVVGNDTLPLVNATLRGINVTVSGQIKDVNALYAEYKAGDLTIQQLAESMEKAGFKAEDLVSAAGGVEAGLARVTDSQMVRGFIEIERALGNIAKENSAFSTSLQGIDAGTERVRQLNEASRDLYAQVSQVPDAYERWRASGAIIDLIRGETEKAEAATKRFNDAVAAGARSGISGGDFKPTTGKDTRALAIQIGTAQDPAAERARVEAQRVAALARQQALAGNLSVADATRISGALGSGELDAGQALREIIKAAPAAQSAVTALKAEYVDLNKALGDTAGSTLDILDSTQSYTVKVTATKEQLAKVAEAQKRYDEAVAKAGKTTGTAAAAQLDLQQAQQRSSLSASNGAESVRKAEAALEAARKSGKNVAQAQLDLDQARARQQIALSTSAEAVAKAQQRVADATTGAGRATAEANEDIAKAKAELDKAKAAAADYTTTVQRIPKDAKTKTELETEESERRARHLMDGMDAIDRRRPRPVVDANTQPALQQFDNVEAGIDALDRRVARVTVAVSDQASGTLDAIDRRVRSIPDRTVRVNVVQYSTPLTGTPQCFAAGTAITLANGNVKGIEHIAVGDHIKAYNFDLRVVEADTVAMLKRAEIARDFIEVVVEGGSTIHCTREHPFYVVDSDKFIAAHALRKGMLLLTPAGTVKVKKVEAFKTRAQVFNFEVENNHNYFAGGVLVHNESVRLDEVFARYDAEISTRMAWLAANGAPGAFERGMSLIAAHEQRLPMIVQPPSVIFNAAAPVVQVTTPVQQAVHVHAHSQAAARAILAPLIKI